MEMIRGELIRTSGLSEAEVCSLSLLSGTSLLFITMAQELSTSLAIC
jgi:hypothetical protein